MTQPLRPALAGLRPANERRNIEIHRVKEWECFHFQRLGAVELGVNHVAEAVPFSAVGIRV